MFGLLSNKLTNFVEFHSKVRVVVLNAVRRPHDYCVIEATAF